MILADAARRSRRAAGPTSSRRRASGCCCSRRADGELGGRDAPGGRARRRRSCCSPRRSGPTPRETLRYFAEQGVALKVISGDNPRTVGAVARRVGLPGADDAGRRPRRCPRTATSSPRCSSSHSVFGRVTPQQKRAIVARAAVEGSRGRDDRRRRERRARAEGRRHRRSRWARAPRRPAAVAQLVLLDSKFSTMPGVVAEGRRVIANIERSANLFVTKTVYAILIAVFVAVGGLEVPVPAAPAHDRQHVHDRHPGLLPRARPEQAALRPRLPRACPPLHDSGRHRRRRRRHSSTYAIAFYGADVPLKRGPHGDHDHALIVGLWVL